MTHEYDVRRTGALVLAAEDTTKQWWCSEETEGRRGDLGAGGQRCLPAFRPEVVVCGSKCCQRFERRQFLSPA